ncbi:MAG: SRPBCC family protein [Rhodococcus sp. (in: high G+C Gram-positive bacteria)]
MHWTGARYADKPIVEVSTWIGARPQRVWAQVSEISVMPRISHELQSVEWLDGSVGPHLGARFSGRNAHDALGEWTSHSQIVEYDVDSVFAWAVGDPDNPSAVWRYDLTALRGGTELRYQVQIGPGPSGLSWSIANMPDKEEKIVFVRMREFEQAMTATLSGIQALAESGEW